ncbi:hypothetical protein KDA_56710 [Dictyobacter alpinus]|uniref:Regulator of SigK n=1 Tax=Dictyobacter alpinus TaxID=2014873 RepID=A0A402BFZ4_9CHLR|nr:anti-sigma factor [Dictyobacter alpinus]GCE30187.1 hypothetical protein KDA_56710 [Dictyobacter alpinus]
MTCQDFEELSGAYILDALTPEEKQAAEEHLANCPECTLLLQQLQPVVNLLPLTVPEVEPISGHKERFFARLEKETAQSASEPEQLPQRPVAHIRQASAKRRLPWRTALLAVAAIILVAALAGMATWNYSLQQQVAKLSTPAVQSATYAIQGTTNQATTTGELTCYNKPQICTLTMRGLPTPTGNQVYQGWLLHGKQPTSVGLLQIKNGIATVDFQGSPQDYDATAVTLEPGPAASKNGPAGPVVALGKLNKATHSS